MGGFQSVVMPERPSASVKSKLEKRVLVGEFLFPSFTNYLVDRLPKRRHDRGVAHSPITAQLPEHSECARGNAAHSHVGNSVEVKYRI